MNTLNSIRSVAFASLVAAAMSASAVTTYSVTAGNGATGTADFTFGTNSLHLVLTDTVVNPNDVAFNLSALAFSFAGGTGGALTGASSATSRTVNGGGTFTDVAGPTTVAGVGWSYSTPASGSYLIDVLAGAGHLGPENTLIGTPGAGGTYSNANGSIASNGPHNPFLYQSATFDFTFSGGVNAATLLTDVAFQFGTTDGILVRGNCTSGCVPVTVVPEPGTYALMLGGLGALAFVARRRRTA